MRFNLPVTLFISGFFLFSSTLSAVEICDNGIDDDGDGYVDCFDSDCLGDADCETDFTSSGFDCTVLDTCDFDLQLGWASDENLYPIDPRSFPIVGDVDNDGRTEIIAVTCMAGGNIYVFDGETGDLDYQFSHPAHRNHKYGAIADIDGDGYAEIFAVGQTNNSENRIHSYRFDPVQNNFLPLAVSDSTYEDVTACETTGAPYITDMNGDGDAEVIVYGSVFDANTLNLIKRSPTVGFYPSIADMFPSVPGLEFITAQAVYSLNFNTRQWTTLISFTGMNTNQTSTAVADFDLDGDLDIIINRQGQIHVKEGQTDDNVVTNLNNVANNCSAPVVVDLESDNIMEILVIKRNTLTCIEDNNGTLQTRWEKRIRDFSGYVTPSFFDFDGDGIREIIVRDQDSLYVIDHLGRTITNYDCNSYTHIEVPVVADVDNDGRAEIVTMCGQGGQGHQACRGGHLEVIEPTCGSWVPARNIWNQHRYFVVNINDDLTVPIRQQAHHLEYPPGSGLFVLNQYCAQANIYNSNASGASTLVVGTPVPDADIRIDTVINAIACPEIIVNYTLFNLGDDSIPVTMPIAFYQDDPTIQGSQPIFLDSTLVPSAIAPGDSANFTVLIQGVGGSFHLYAVANDTGHTAQAVDFSEFPVTDVLECNYFNNMDDVQFTFFQVEICDDGFDNDCNGLIDDADTACANKLPVAIDDTITIPEDTTDVIINVTDNDYDPDISDTLSVTIIDGPGSGTATVLNDDSISYTPNPNFNGNDTITYQLCDQDSGCDTAIVVIVVTPVNDPPIVIENGNSADTIVRTTPEEVALEICILATEADGDPYDVISVISPAQNGTVTGIASGDSCFTYLPDSNFVGTDVVVVLVCDDQIPAGCDTVTVIIEVTPLNDPPVIVDTSGTPIDTLFVSTPEDSTLFVCLDVVDIDFDNIDVVSVQNGPSNGSIGGLADGDTCFSYTPSPDYNGPDRTTIIVCDDGNPVLCDTIEVVIDVTPVNDPPVITDPQGIPADTLIYFTDEDTPIEICLDVFDIDIDLVDVVSVISGPFNGTMTGFLDGDTCFTYAPDSNFNGLDGGVIVVCDNGNPTLCDTVTIGIVVNPANDPPVITENGNPVDTIRVITQEETPIEVCFDVVDIDGDLVDITSIVRNPVNGSVSGLNDGDTCITYTPDLNFEGTDTLVAVVCDDGNPTLCDTVVVIIQVVPENDPPVVTDTSGNPIDTIYVTTPEDTPVIICIDGFDIDGDNFDVVAVFGGPLNGSISGLSDGDTCLTYSPDPDYNGGDVFSAVICDDAPLFKCDTVVVVVLVTPVNDPPVIIDTSGNPTDTVRVTTPEEVPITVCLDGIDIDGDPFSVVDAIRLPNNGSVSGILTGDSCFTYAPDTNFNGQDTVIVVSCDTADPAGCDTTVVIIDVTPDNDPPVIVDTSGNPTDTIYTSTSEDSSVLICLNGFDIDGDIFDVTAVLSGPFNGSVSGLNDGDTCILYTPDDDFNGTDIIRVTVCDNGTPVACDTIVIIIDVIPANDPPVVTDPNGNPVDTIFSSTDEDMPVEVCFDGIDIDGDPFDITDIIRAPNNGTITGLGDGDSCFTYIPDPDFNGTDTLIAVTCDTANPAGCDTTVVIIEVIPTNDPPVVVDSTGNPTDTIYVTTPEDTPVIICFEGFDIDGDNFDITGILTNPANGSITGINDGDTCFTYIPDDDFNGVDVVVVTVCDDGNPVACDTITVIITVTPVNDPPVVTDPNGNPVDTIRTNTLEDVPVEICIDGIDIDGDNFDVTDIIRDPMNGTVTGIGDGDSCFTYIPDDDFSGTDTLIAVICDDGIPEACDTVVIIIEVEEVNFPPIAVDDSTTIEDGNPLVIDVQENDNDPDGDPLTTTITSPPSDGTAEVVDGDSIIYTPDPTACGYDTLIYTICDPSGLCDDAMVIILNIPADSDNDGIHDFAEGFTLDTDNDGVPDYLDPDSDNDGISDSAETIPFAFCDSIFIDTDGDGTPDFRDLDSDNDTLLDWEESTDNPPFPPTGVDSDGDGIDDAYDPDLGSGLIDDPVDTDNDGLPDFRDLDSDGDGEDDFTEGIGDCDYDGILNFQDAQDDCPDLEIPEGFSPNNDQVNDVFVIKRLEELYPENEFVVFNRWGAEVYRQTNYANDWDGRSEHNLTLNGKLPVGTYYYILDLFDGNKPRTGFFFLNR